MFGAGAISQTSLSSLAAITAVLSADLVLKKVVGAGATQEAFKNTQASTLTKVQLAATAKSAYVGTIDKTLGKVTATGAPKESLVLSMAKTLSKVTSEAVIREVFTASIARNVGDTFSTGQAVLVPVGVADLVLKKATAVGAAKEAQRIGAYAGALGKMTLAAVTHTGPTLAQAKQSLTPGDLIHLYTLDLNPIGVSQIYYFTPTNNNGVPISFDDQEYTYTAVDVTGVDWNINGDQAEAKLMIPNGSKFASGLVLAYQDLVGARVTRVRTYRQFLDGEELEDPNAVLSRDVFTIEQKTNINRIFAEFSLRPLASLQGRKIPNRVCLKNICTHKYRVYDAGLGAFNYDNATCPYVGASKFKADNTTTTNPALDVCAKDLDACILRFGNAPLPTRAFPGMNRVRV